MSETPKSYGQMAYEAYCEHTGWKSLVSGAALPQWVDLKPEIKSAWESSSRAVITAFVKRVRVEAEARFRELEPEAVGYSSNALLMAFDQLAKEVES